MDFDIFFTHVKYLKILCITRPNVGLHFLFSNFHFLRPESDRSVSASLLGSFKNLKILWPIGRKVACRVAVQSVFSIHSCKSKVFVSKDFVSQKKKQSALHSRKLTFTSSSDSSGVFLSSLSSSSHP